MSPFAEEVASTQLARENWYYLAEHWDQAAQLDCNLDQHRQWQEEPHNNPEVAKETRKQKAS
ncbi:MAG: hypothetical protein Q8M31_12625 [Beijerinckiaceae bacterium]|nr:hypothetical protein [Beijerinckiaceae bacterium]